MSELDKSYHHIPVLLKASVDELVIDPNGIYIDVTYGGGGHSAEILNRLSEKGKLVAFDKDPKVAEHLPADKRFEWIYSDFRYLKKYMDYFEIKQVDGILADLGLSSHHLDESNRGFSIFSDKPFDMRMNTRQVLTANHILKNYSESQLESMIKNYGELTNARLIAKQLVLARKKLNFNSCKEVASWVSGFAYGNKVKFLAQFFQAFRIEVNREIESLKNLLEQASSIIKPGGQMVVISYHSLEDRLVKHWFRSGNDEEGTYSNHEVPFKPKYKHAILPDEQEIKMNSRSRSAKMRVGIKN